MATSLISGGQHLNLLTLPITTAQAAQVGNIIKLPSHCIGLSVLANFTYGSGGTTADAWVQTSLDGGNTWMDIFEFSFALASAKKAMTVISESAVLTPTTPADGTLTANTAIAGFIGDRVRVKYTTVGTYGGSTVLQIDAIAKSMMVLA